MSNPVLGQLYAPGGHFRIFARPPQSGQRIDITLFRGAPTKIESMSSNDPFGDAAATLSFPQITGRDKPGQGDLFWLVPWTNIDIVWYNTERQPTDWVWEGLMVSEDIRDASSGISLKGALYQADNFLAAPWYPQYPVPYEILIKQALDPAVHATLGTTPLQVIFPDDWPLVVPQPATESYLWFLKPWGVSPGQKWTGLTSRSTGSWEPSLTGYVQTMLSVMYTPDGGQWTIVKRTGRAPVLQVRSVIMAPTADTIEVYFGVPGVHISLSRDFTQSANVIFGTGTDKAGTTFSGSQVSSDGQSTYYDPFAFLPIVHPSNPSNPALNLNVRRKEMRLQFPQGMSTLEATKMAQTHLQRLADPGFTGTVQLNNDPLKGGLPYNRMLIRAGEQILVKGFRGTDMLFHITSSTVSPSNGTVSLNIDSKFRDALTVGEVLARTKDALNPVTLLQVGKYSTTVQDSIKPWSYQTGSGVVPSGTELDATALFTQLMPPTERFPWTETLRRYPPKTYPNYYIRIGPRSVTNADSNWSGITRLGRYYASIPIRMSQAGTIRLSQFVIVDENGNIIPSPFHVSLYSNTVTRDDMPRIYTGVVGAGGYPAGQHYPYFQGAFEHLKPSGEEQDQIDPMLPNGAGLVVGWGNYYQAAGYSPGSSTTPGATPTGQLVDETAWGFDTSGNSLAFNQYDAKATQNNSNAGILEAMAYCDGQGDRPVFLIGRLFRAEA